MLSLLNPLHLARTVAVAALGGVRVGGVAARAAGSLAVELADETLAIVRGRARVESEPPVAARPAPRDRRSVTPAPPARPSGDLASTGPSGDLASTAHSPAKAPAPAPEPPGYEPVHAPQEPPLEAELEDEELEDEVVVASVADPGAEGGAGAEVHVDPPWRGYAKMRAADVIDRLSAEPEAAVSVVLLYERAHRRRRTVLDAAQQELERRRAVATG